MRSRSNINVADVEINAIETFAERIIEEIPDMPTTDIILFGSYARGDYTENSDIDILILANDTEKRLREAYFSRITEILSDINLEYDVFMTIILDSTEEYSKTKNHTPVFKNVERDGILLWTNQSQSVI